MSYWRNISPSGAIGDFVHEFTRPNPYRWPIIGVSLAATFTLFSVMWNEGGEGPPPRPEVTYITTFAPGRTTAEIIASNEANQRRKAEAAAEQAARDERVKSLYRTLGRVSGMDVDKIEREAAVEREQAKQAEEARFAGRRATDGAQPATTEAPETSAPAPQTPAPQTDARQ